METKYDQQDALIDGCLAGDPSSQRQLFESQYGKMLGVCMRYAADSDQAKDMLQEGFIKVFNHLERFNRKGSLEGWIRRIVVNNAIDTIRRDKRSLIVADSEELLDEGAEWDEQPFEKEETPLEVDDVMNAMQRLSPAYRTVFNLYVLEERTHKEIAAQLGISEGTSKSNLAKARRNLKKILRDEGVIKE